MRKLILCVFVYVRVFFAVMDFVLLYIVCDFVCLCVILTLFEMD